MKDDFCPKMKSYNSGSFGKCDCGKCDCGKCDCCGCCCMCPPGPQGPEGPEGPAGEAATIQIGTVTTGAPGTPARVTNSGTAQNAIFNFVIPQGEQGESGESCDLQYLTAYSIPSQGAASGNPVVFDRNSSSKGTAVTHANNSASIMIQKTGYYLVTFFGTVTATEHNTFPFSQLLNLVLGGTAVTGAGARQGFQQKNQSENVSLSKIIPVTSAPVALQVVGEGGNVLYSDTSITVYRVGSL